MSEIETLQLQLFSLQRDVFSLTEKLAELKAIKRLSDAPAMKKCPKCKAVKPREEFYFDVRYKDGLYPTCRICKAEQYRKRRAA